MRIIMVSNNYTPYSGGVVSALDALIPALQAAGHEVTLITLSFLQDHSDDPSWVVRVPHIGQWMYKENHIAIPWGADSFVLDFIKKSAPAIIHAHHPFLLGSSALKVARELGLPLVFTYHTLYEQQVHYIPVPEWLGAPCIQKMVQSYCAQVDGIIAPSSTVQKYIQQLLLPNDVVCEVIPSCLLSIFMKQKTFTPKEKVAGDPFKLVTVGRFVLGKNMRQLLDLFARLDQKNFSFTLIGYGSEFEETKRYAYDHLGLSPSVVSFIHKPEKAIIAQHYRAADLFLFGSTKDTQGLVLAESMASGTPIVAFDGPGQRDSVRPGVNGFLVNSVEQMREKIMQIAHDPQLHETLQKGAFLMAQAYRPEVIVDRLSSFYQKLVNMR